MFFVLRVKPVEKQISEFPEEAGEVKCEPVQKPNDPLSILITYPSLLLVFEGLFDKHKKQQGHGEFFDAVLSDPLNLGDRRS
mmetsp:Transcript_3997/g.4423  ORF Transcript_3997/g.4423 Transcript_3997/m.4423 type:complete len:82 (-) Transcript_3997:273-518(-)